MDDGCSRVPIVRIGRRLQIRQHRQRQGTARSTDGPHMYPFLLPARSGALLVPNADTPSGRIIRLYVALQLLTVSPPRLIVLMRTVAVFETLDCVFQWQADCANACDSNLVRERILHC